jgi:hypothetical protein
MNKAEAIQIIHNSLVAYIEDSAGADSEEAKDIDKAWEIIKQDLEDKKES